MLPDWYDDCTVSAVRSDAEKRGGQHAGPWPSIIRIEHHPTGIVVEVPVKNARGGDSPARSQHMARLIALEMIEWGLTHER